MALHLRITRGTQLEISTGLFWSHAADQKLKYKSWGNLGIPGVNMNGRYAGDDAVLSGDH